MRERALLVEDEFIVALEVQFILEDAGLEVLGPYPSAHEALAALDAADGRAFACAVLDVRLRDGDVFPVAERLRDKGVPIVFHSGHAEPEQLRSAYPDAIFCGKPCSPGVLLDSVRKLVAERVDAR